MEDTFGHRCWYTEANESVSTYDVDHFRPKGRIDRTTCSFTINEEDRNFGVDNYWWLAFEYTNYRLSGRIPNENYKKCYFPLFVGSYVANNWRDPHWKEKVILIDPTIKTDVKLLCHNSGGRVSSTETQASDPLSYYRANVSIEVYGINDDLLITKRQILWIELSNTIEWANNSFELLKSIPTKSGTEYNRELAHYNNYLETIRNYFGSTKEFLSCARGCLISHGYEWIKPEIFDKITITF